MGTLLPVTSERPLSLLFSHTPPSLISPDKESDEATPFFSKNHVPFPGFNLPP